jgi:hypothetical protein
MYRRRGPIPNSKRLLCVILRCGHVKATALLNALIKAGKITLSEDGMLANQRVTKELVEREYVATNRRVAGHKGGTNSGVARRKSLENQDSHEANASTSSNQRREEKREDSKSERAGVQIPTNMQARMLAELPSGVDWPIRISMKLQPIFECLEAGADFEKHVLPVIHEEAKNAHAAGRKLFSWDNVVPQIMAAVEREKRPAPAKQDEVFTDDLWDRAITGWKRTKHWSYGKWSLPPDMPGCKIPQHVLAAHGYGRVAA